MLEQRRAQDKGYITLKEAAQLSNYTPDYIGQLIRAGKLKGEQVYANVAWVTTEEDILAYLDKRANGEMVTESVPSFFDKYSQVFSRSLLYVLIGVFAVAILLMQYILYVTLDDKYDQTYLSTAEQAEST